MFPYKTKENNTNITFYAFHLNKYEFSKKSANFLEIWPQICTILESDVLALKLLFFKILRRGKISQKIIQHIFIDNFFKI